MSSMASRPTHPLGDLTPRPPMGWSSWNTFGTEVSADLVLETAEAMVAGGMRAAGYTYVDVDDGWMAPERDARGRLVPDPARFPDGIAPVADRVHALGLRLGIYSSAGTTTCAGLPGSLDHEDTDARSFAAWGVDQLKYDNCGETHGRGPRERFTAMSRALAAAGRPVLFALCDWGTGRDWEWNGEHPVGHTWRSTGDIRPAWDSVLATLDNHAWVTSMSGPNSWGDPDMLEVGVPPLTYAESRAHLALWAVVNAPLVCGHDVRTAAPEVRDLLTNPLVVAVDQDWSGRAGERVGRDGDAETWVKTMSDGSRAVVLLNRGGTPREVGAGRPELGLTGALAVRDVWTGRNLSDGEVRAEVAPHDAAFLLVTEAPTP